MVDRPRGDDVHADTNPVRPGEELNIEALSQYLQSKIAGAEHGVSVAQFAKGHSNLTYLLKAGDHEYVLRRGPLGPVPPKAHDMAREYGILHAVHPHFPEAPQVFHLCDDPSVIGGVFFLMERRNGFVLRDTIPAEVLPVQNYPQRISEAFISCLVRLHAIDLAPSGLLSLGKPDGFLERQVEGWAERWQRAKTDETPVMDFVIRWLRERRPPSGKPTLVHNDYKLDNVMLPAGNVDRIEAVLDWEMTTVGDPLADLGLTLCYWTWANLPELQSPVACSITAQAAWFTREQLIMRYAELSGRDVLSVRYYEVLGVFKLAAILQQIYYRFRRGQTADARFENFGDRVQALVRVAASLTDKVD
jgi:aminoglycoside phosphotransferase (APT) family kinase protein